MEVAIVATSHVGTGAPPIPPGTARLASTGYLKPATCARPPGRGVRAYVRGLRACRDRVSPDTQSLTDTNSRPLSIYISLFINRIRLVAYL